MAEDRLRALRTMLERRPDDLRLRFGVALELLGSGKTEEGVEMLRAYLDEADDEGNAWGRLGSALLDLDRREEAREAYRSGREAARRHGHPTMAEEFDEILSDWEE